MKRLTSKREEDHKAYLTQQHALSRIKHGFMGSSKSMSGCIEVGHTALAFHSFRDDNIKAKTGQNRNNNKTAIKTSRKGRRIATCHASTTKEWFMLILSLREVVKLRVIRLKKVIEQCSGLDSMSEKLHRAAAAAANSSHANFNLESCSSPGVAGLARKPLAHQKGLTWFPQAAVLLCFEHCFLLFPP